MQKIGEILVTKGYVTQQQLDGVLAVKGEDAQVGQVLIEWGLLTQEQLIETLSTPQFNNLLISSTLLTPPPTVSGTKHFLDVFSTTS